MEFNFSSFGTLRCTIVAAPAFNACKADEKE